MTENGLRRRARKWHVGEKAVIDHLVRGGAAVRSHAPGRVHAAVTASGLCVEEQIRKASNRITAGLAIF